MVVIFIPERIERTQPDKGRWKIKDERLELVKGTRKKGYITKNINKIKDRFSGVTIDTFNSANEYIMEDLKRADEYIERKGRGLKKVLGFG